MKIWINEELIDSLIEDVREEEIEQMTVQNI